MSVGRARTGGCLGLTIVALLGACGGDHAPARGTASDARHVRTADSSGHSTPRELGSSYDDRRARLRGILVYESGEDVDATFYPVSSANAAIDLSTLATIDAASLMAGAATVDLFGVDARTMSVVTPADSTLRAALTGPCDEPFKVKLRGGARASPFSWSVGLRSGAAHALVAATRSPSERLADEAEAVRLADSAPEDHAIISDSLPSTGVLMRGLPYRVEDVRVIVDGDIEVMFATTYRRNPKPVGPESITVGERVSIVAERAHKSGGPFGVVWASRLARDNDELARRSLITALRIGVPPYLALVMGFELHDVRGGELLARLAPGKWEIVGTWSNSCD